MGRKGISEQAMVNKRATIMYTIVTVVIAIAYLAQYLKGEKELGLLIALLAIDLIPMIITWIMIGKNPEARYARTVIAVGYGSFYALSCFTSTELTVYAYAIPMIIAITIFNNVRYSCIVACICGLISLGHAVWFAALQGFESMAVARMEIEICVMVMVCSFLIYTNKTLADIAKTKVDEINTAGEKTSELLDGVMAISGKLAEGVTDVSSKIRDLEETSKETYDAMMEVQSGTGESAESIQNQLIKTEEIQTQIDMVTNVAQSIGNDVVQTVEACHEGRDNIKELLVKSQVSEEAGLEVVKEVEELKIATEKMQSIVAMIKSVASQTSLLALNASIEAARAGDAGRGFAVVASEISNLANQTQTATGNISDLITDISSEIADVVTSINSLVENNRAQNESANITNGSFEKIIENIRSIRTNSNNLTGVVNKLVGANQEIVESIQTISAITEEVSAHSSNTCTTTERNQTIVADIISLVEEMSRNAEELAGLNL